MNYSDNFDAYSAGAGLPAGWTSRWDAGTWSIVDASGDKLLRENSGSQNRYFASFDAINADANRDNCEVLARIRTANASGSIMSVGLVLRGSGNGSSEQGYVAGFFADDLRIGKYVAGTFTEIRLRALTLAANTWYWLRFRVNGTTLQTKLWADGSGEPGTWDTTDTDSSISGTGWAGAFSFMASANKDFAEVAVATNGDTATMGGGAAALAGAAAGTAAATGDLATGIPLAGAAAAAAGATGSIDTPVVFDYTADRCNLLQDGARTYVSGSGASPTVTMEFKRFTNTDAAVVAQRAFVARLTGLAGKTPTLRVRIFESAPSTGGKFSGQPPEAASPAGWRPWVSADGVAWAKLTTAGVLDADQIHRNFVLDAAWGSDVLYFCSHPPWSVGRTQQWVGELKTAYPSFIHETLSSSGFVVDTTLASSDEFGRSIAAQPLLGFRVTDLGSSPPGGKVKMIWISGTHPEEDPGTWNMKGALDWWLSADAKAVQMRETIDLYVYPCATPNGRYAGSSRTAIDGNATYRDRDANRIWTTSGPDQSGKLKAKILADTGGAAVAFTDWHATAGGDGFYSYFKDAVHPAVWDAAIDPYTADNTPSSYSSIAGTSDDWAQALAGARYTQTHEQGMLWLDGPTEWQQAGAASAQAIADLVNRGYYHALAGAAAAQATATGALAGGAAALEGAAISVSTALAALSTAIQLAGQAQAVAAATADLGGGPAALAGAAQSAATAAADLFTAINLAGAAVAQASASGGLAGSAAALDGAAAATATAIAALNTATDLGGSAAALSTAAGALDTAIRLAGLAAGLVTASAGLAGTTAGIPMIVTAAARGYLVTAAARTGVPS